MPQESRRVHSGFPNWCEEFGVIAKSVNVTDGPAADRQPKTRLQTIVARRPLRSSAPHPPAGHAAAER